MFAPGSVALAVSVLVLLFMKDSPETEGFPPIDEGAPKKVLQNNKTAGEHIPNEGFQSMFYTRLAEWLHIVVVTVYVLSWEVTKGVVAM